VDAAAKIACFANHWRARGSLDGCLDFFFEEAVRKTFGWKQWTEDEYTQFMTRQAEYFPRDFIMPTFIDNHDMDRFLYLVNGDKELAISNYKKSLELNPQNTNATRVLASLTGDKK